MVSIERLAARRRALSPRDAGAFVPGVLLCLGVTGAAEWLQAAEADLLGRAWLEALVLAILLGTALRAVWTPGRRWVPGVNFSAKTLLEIAIVLLGATVSAGMIASAGFTLLFGVMGVVAVSIVLSYGLGRLAGLPPRMATLIACGNSICGNSAIAAVAPVIGAHSEDVGASIAFTAVLGVAVVLLLPLLPAALHLQEPSFGILAGLTVYAVPQVIAATAPVGAVAVQVGTFVKLLRVLMLGPVVLGLSVLVGRSMDPGTAGRAKLPGLSRLVPWFILGFLALMAARSFGLLPGEAIAWANRASSWLTVVSMAALGLGVDVRALLRAGARVTAVVSGSLLLLGVLSLGLIWVLGGAHPGL